MYSNQSTEGIKEPLGQKSHSLTGNKNYLVIGHGRHGKDTVAEFMAEARSGLTFSSSSEFCAEHIVYPTMKDMYPDWKACYADRANHRNHWFETIRDYGKDDLCRLAREIFEWCDIYVGLRNIEEFRAAQDLFDLVIWVERPDYPQESETSMNLIKDDADIVIYNDGTLEDLKRKVYNLML